MKVLWVNPSFLDYRVPFYKALNEICSGNFHLVYSKGRVPARCISKIEEALGENAHGLTHEACWEMGDSEGSFSCTGVSIPFPAGLSEILKSIDADVMIAEGFFQWTPWALVRAAGLKIPLLIAYERTAHTERHCPWWRLAYRKFINHFVKGYLVNGSLCRNYLESTMMLKGKAIQEGIMAADSEALAAKVGLLKTSEPAQGLRYLFVGRLVAVKGIEYLLRAWQLHVQKYTGDSLTIVGDGPESGKLSTIPAEGAIFAGAVDYDLIHQYYAQADVFVIPTLEDNWSLVVPEAMACGLPVACSCYNGCHPELVKEGVNGTVFNPLIQESIERALAYFHLVDLKKMGEKSREIVNYYSPEKCAERAYRGILKSLEEV